MRRTDIKEKPDLLFPEFDGQYIYKSFGKVLLKEARSLKMEDESEYRLVTVKRGYGGVVPRGIFKGKEILVKSQFSLKKNDFLISKRQICHNACGIVPADLEGAIVSNEYTVFIPKRDLDISYFNYFCCMPIISHTFFLSSIGVHIEKMLFKVDDWLKWEFPFPSLPEQKKIASFLSAVDRKIQLLIRKKELMEQYKKGVMQKIFSQEIRFKDENGKNYPDWEEKRLGEVATITMGQSPESKSYNNNAIGMLLIQGNADINNRHSQPRQWTSEPTKTCEEGHLILTVRAPVGSISKSIHNACIGRGVCSIKNKNNSDIEFLYQILLDYEPKWSRLEQGSTFTAVSGSDIKSIKINLPYLPEQQKITSFLLNIDNKIESVKIQITQAQNFKKGLLQQMFV